MYKILKIIHWYKLSVNNKFLIPSYWQKRIIIRLEANCNLIRALKKIYGCYLHLAYASKHDIIHQEII